MSGQIYAEFQIPAHQRHPYPIVFIHGGAQTGTNFTGTPDGREGWAQFFLRQGYAVYVVDQAGRGRSAYQESVYGPQATSERRLRASNASRPIENYNQWPQAHLHTQWPGKGTPGDPVFDQFFASQVQAMVSYPLQQEFSSRRHSRAAREDRPGDPADSLAIRSDRLARGRRPARPGESDRRGRAQRAAVLQRG